MLFVGRSNNNWFGSVNRCDETSQSHRGLPCRFIPSSLVMGTASPNFGVDGFDPRRRRCCAVVCKLPARMVTELTTTLEKHKY
jgi:hypothetical protein